MSEHAVVTGGSSGIGATVVRRLVKRGHAVTILDVTEPTEGSLEHVRYKRVDVTNAAMVKRAMEESAEACGPVTHLVASHGVRGAFRPAIELDADSVNRVFAVHVTGTLLVANALASQTRGAGLTGSVVTMSSTTAYGGWANQADYGAAKAAVKQLSQNLAIEWAPFGIRVNCVAPGHTLTPMVQEMIDEGYDVAATQARTPLGRFAMPQEVAGAIEHLLLDATFTTGVCLPVDGGWTTVGK